MNQMAPSENRLRNLVFLQFLLILALAAMTAWNLFPVFRNRLDPNAAPRTVTPRGDLAEDEKSTIALFDSASPSVVHIQTEIASRLPFSMNMMETRSGLGTGFIWDQDGRIVTNFHVVRDASNVSVTLNDRSTWQARLVAGYPEKDLAVLQIGAPKAKLRPIPSGLPQTFVLAKRFLRSGILLDWIRV